MALWFGIILMECPRGPFSMTTYLDPMLRCVNNAMPNYVPTTRPTMAWYGCVRSKTKSETMVRDIVLFSGYPHVQGGFGTIRAFGWEQGRVVHDAVQRRFA